MRRKLVKIEEYEIFVGAEIIGRIKKKAELLQDTHITNINSTKKDRIDSLFVSA